VEDENRESGLFESLLSPLNIFPRLREVLREGGSKFQRDSKWLLLTVEFRRDVHCDVSITLVSN
jgi:hypothetical protein